MKDSAAMRWRHVTIRAVGVVAVIVAILLCLSEWQTGFWSDHQMLGAFVSGLLLFAIGSALVNEYLAARSRSRWATVAALALREFQASCHSIDASVSDVVNQQAGSAGSQNAGVDGTVRDVAAVARVLSDADRRSTLKQAIDVHLRSARPIVTAWAPVMIGEPHYVGYLDQFVGVLSRAWRISWVLENAGVSDEAIATELCDWMAQVARLEAVLSARIERLLPWPKEFGEPPGR